MMELRRGQVLVGAWLVLFGGRVAGLSDPLTLWALRALTVAILVAACVVVVRFTGERIAALRRGERVLTEPTVRGLLLGALVVGLVLRVVGWDSGEEGIVAWVGGILMIIAICGLVALQFLRERASWVRGSFYFDPRWKYGLLLICLVALTIPLFTGLEGTVFRLCAAFFWIALIGLAIQAGGRWILRLRGDGASPSAGAGH